MGTTLTLKSTQMYDSAVHNTSGRNKRQKKLIGRFLKIGHFVGY